MWTVIVEIGRVADAVEYRLSRDGGEIARIPQPVIGGVQYTFTTSEEEVLVRLAASALDAAGNESLKTMLDIPLDSTAPVAPTLRLVTATWTAAGTVG